MTTGVPVIDVGPLIEARRPDAMRSVASELDAACRDTGFFAITGHGVDPALCAALDAAARAFFARPDPEKAAIGMAHGGRAWRGWFPVGGELTSGVPDRKEGIYFGAEIPFDDDRVRAGRPLHGPNLFPVAPAALEPLVLAWLDALTELGATVMRGIALGLGLDAEWFARDLTRDPTILFRIFRYPPVRNGADANAWGVGEHTDYGLLTILMQDAAGGLQVHTPGGWLDVPPLPGAFVCNIGDMLERMTGGRYRSTPHRVRSPGDRERVSFAFFFDPGWDALVRSVPQIGGAARAGRDRWDGNDLDAFAGTYGEYLVDKVSKVFPALREEVL